MAVDTPEAIATNSVGNGFAMAKFIVSEEAKFPIVSFAKKVNSCKPIVIFAKRTLFRI